MIELAHAHAGKGFFIIMMTRACRHCREGGHHTQFMSVMKIMLIESLSKGVPRVKEGCSFVHAQEWVRFMSFYACC